MDALADLTRAAELFEPIFARTNGIDGWVSLEVSPLPAHDTNSTLAAVRNLHQRGGKANLFIKIPGNAEGLPAIEAASFAGVPVNVTLLFLRSNTSQRPKPTSAAWSAHRGGAEPSSNLRRLTFCQPLGHCGQWQDSR